MRILCLVSLLLSICSVCDARRVLFHHRPMALARNLSQWITSNDVGGCTGKPDSSMAAACFRFDAAVFESSAAVARILVRKSEGGVFCTGWLLGCEGHVLTNHHCVSNSKEASTVTIEFLTQATTCSQSCDAPWDCPGTVEVTGADLVAFSPSDQLDYALLRPRLSPKKRLRLVRQYGFLSLRYAGPCMNERIYIPQHPRGTGKRISMKTFEAKYGRVVAMEAVEACNGRVDNVGYLLDTQGGSSGAPVIAYSDKSVVGLHYCGGCRNGAIPSTLIIESLLHQSALPSCTVSELALV